MATKKKVTEEQVVETEVLKEEKPKKKTIKIEKNTNLGEVVNCGSLFMRDYPSKNGSKIVTVIKVGTVVTIDPERSTVGYFYVKLSNGFEGYCDKSYIEMK